MLRQEQVENYVLCKKDFRTACIKNGYILPTNKRFVTRKFMQEAREGSCFCLNEATLQRKWQCPLRPSADQLFEILRQVITTKAASLPLAAGAPYYRFLNPHCKKGKRPDSDYIVLMIGHITNGTHEIFQKSYKPPKNVNPIAFEYSNADGFFTDLPQTDSKVKRKTTFLNLVP
jgi:hypothetical protein